MRAVAAGVDVARRRSSGQDVETDLSLDCECVSRVAGVVVEEEEEEEG
jgi:hypothetical protein